MACESFVEHLVGPLYFLQRTLFLRFSQISMPLAIYLYLRAGVLACQGWVFLNFPYPRDSMPRSSTTVWALNDVASQQAKGPFVYGPTQPSTKDAFDKFK